MILKIIKKKIDKNFLKTIDLFIEKNKEKKEYLNSLKNKITNFKKKSSSLSTDKENILNYLELKTDLAILKLTEKVEKEEVRKEKDKTIFIVNYEFFKCKTVTVNKLQKNRKNWKTWDKLTLIEEKEAGEK